MTKQDLKHRIQKHLKTVALGTTISSLADELGSTRITITKYLKELEEENKVKLEDVGGFQVWTLVNGKEKINKSKFAYIFLLRELFRSIDRYTDRSLNWRIIGKDAAKHLKLHEVLDTHDLFDVMKRDKPILENGADVFHKIFSIISNLFDDCEIDTPIIIGKPPIIILRIRNSRYYNTPQMLDITAGIIEYHIGKEFGGLQIQVDLEPKIEEKIIDVIIKINMGR